MSQNIKIRFDFGSITKVESKLDSNGYLRISGTVARVGIMDYLERTPRGDAKVFKSLVTPDVLFDTESMAGLTGVPVTLDHPPVAVTPENAKQYQVGSVTYSAAINGEMDAIVVDMVITDKAAIDAIIAGKVGLSPGYGCIEDDNAGEWNGIKYDRRQLKRIYNHLAIVDNARGGEKCRLSFDHAIQQEELNNMQENKPTEQQEEQKSVETQVETQETEVTTENPVETKVEPESKDEPQEQEPTIADVLKIVTALAAKVDAMEKPAEEKPVEKNDAVDTVKMDAAAVANMVDVVLKAKTLKPTLDHMDGEKAKTAREVMLEAILTVDADFKADGKSDDYIAGKFDSALESVKKDRIGDQRRVINNDSGVQYKSAQSEFVRKFYEGKA